MAPKFNYGKTFLLGFGFLGISIIWPIFNQYLPIFLQAGNPEFEKQLLAEGRAIPEIIGFGLAPSLALFIMTWDNILNMFIQPWVGAKSDLTWNRFGRRKPWILIGAPIALLGFIFIPIAQSADRNCSLHFDHQSGHGNIPLAHGRMAGRPFRTERTKQSKWHYQLDGGHRRTPRLFCRRILVNSFGRSAPFIAGAIPTAIALITVLIFVKEPERIQVENLRKTARFI